MNADKIRARVEGFSEVCRQNGIKTTHQRSVIYRELVETDEHPDVETIYKRVKLKIPEISLDTVYRTLRLLEEKGIISRLGSHTERTRFDANADQHHHFVCTQCGLVSDFYSEELNAFPPPKAVNTVGVVHAVHVEMKGICNACAEAHGE